MCLGSCWRAERHILGASGFCIWVRVQSEGCVYTCVKGPDSWAVEFDSSQPVEKCTELPDQSQKSLWPVMLPSALYPSQTKPRNLSRLRILRHAAERKGLYFLPGNFGECNPPAFKINSCSHSPAMLADGPVPRSEHVCAQTDTQTHGAVPLAPFGKRGPCSKANVSCPRIWVLLATHTPTLCWPRDSPGWGEHQRDG